MTIEETARNVVINKIIEAMDLCAVANLDYFKLYHDAQPKYWTDKEERQARLMIPGVEIDDFAFRIVKEDGVESGRITRLKEVNDEVSVPSADERQAEYSIQVEIRDAYREAAVGMFGITPDQAAEAIYTQRDDPGEWAPKSLVILNMETGWLGDYYEPGHIDRFYDLGEAANRSLEKHTYIEYQNAAIAAVFYV